MRHAYWRRHGGGLCDCKTLSDTILYDSSRGSAWAGDYFTTSRELTYDLAQLLGDYCAEPDTDTRPRGDQT